MILAGDVGGTKVNLALCEVHGNAVSVRSLRRYSSAEFTSLSEVLGRYLNEVGLGKTRLDSAAFGVPGPVHNGRCKTVNLPWSLDAFEIEHELRHHVDVGPVRLLNDLEATAHGIRALENDRGLSTLRTGVPGESEPLANKALIAPGTGLGEAMLIWDGARHVVSPSEGGHADFGPQDDEQIELLRWLWPRHEHVSWEHVASGPGIHRLYRFLKETGREHEPPELERKLAEPGVDPSPIIAAFAISGEHRICVRAFDLWLFFVGAEAGNLALKCVSTGGVYVGGGIIPNILELFKRPSFFKGLNSKGRMSGILKPMPVFGIVDPLAALYGAALSAGV
ncbi:MAG: glucokinase [Deltaproteobacteria bacterium]|nr:glucokinase [Deltaproteobacteria bacterium]